MTMRRLQSAWMDLYRNFPAPTRVEFTNTLKTQYKKSGINEQKQQDNTRMRFPSPEFDCHDIERADRID